MVRLSCRMQSRGTICSLGFLLVILTMLPGDSPRSQVKPLDKSSQDLRDPQVESLLDQTESQGGVYAVGEASIVNGNVSEARQRALQAAYAEAVAVGAGVSVGSLTLIRNVSQITDLVTTQSSGFISDYEVIQESVLPSSNGQILRMEIEATVLRQEATSQEERLNGLRLFLQVLGNPRVLIIAPYYDATMNQPGVSSSAQSRASAESDSGTAEVKGQFSSSASVAGNRDYEGTPDASLDSTIIRAAEAALAQQLNKYGYTTYTIDSLFGKVDNAVLGRAERGDTAAAISAAREVGADIALIGRFVGAARRINPQGVEFEQVSIEYSSRATIVSTGEEVRTFSLSSTKAHSNMLSARNEATSMIAEQVAEELAWKIPDILANSRHSYQVFIQNFSAEQALEMNSMLSQIEGVVQTRIMQLPSQRDASARFELEMGYIKVPASEIYMSIDSQLDVPMSLQAQNAFEMKLALDR